MRDDEARVADIIEACEQIVTYIGADEARFRSDPIAQAAAQRWLEIIGEAASRLSDEFKASHAQWHGGTSPACAPSLLTATSMLTRTSSGRRSPATFHGFSRPSGKPDKRGARRQGTRPTWWLAVERRTSGGCSTRAPWSDDNNRETVDAQAVALGNLHDSQGVRGSNLIAARCWPLFAVREVG